MSKKSLRVSRRNHRKAEYKKYLESPAWKQIRAKVLRRDGYRCRARTCDEPATVVHHVRYPMRLGEEKLEWLYSLCAPCHDTIHAIKGVTLREATAAVLDGMITKNKTITYLADDPALLRQRPPRPQKKQRRTRARLRQASPAHLTADVPKSKLQLKNDELHEIQKRARENRQARLDAIATRESIATLSSEYGFRPRST